MVSTLSNLAFFLGTSAVLIAAFPATSAAQHTTKTQVLLNIEPSSEAPRNSEGDILPLKDRRLALVYTRFTSGADDHSAADLAMRTSEDSGNTWSPDHILLKNEGGANVMSVSLHRVSSGKILLFYLRKEDAGSECQIMLRTSADELKTLSDPVQVSNHKGYHVMNNARVLETSTGRLLAPAILHSGFDDTDEVTSPVKFSERGVPFVYFSDDQGQTWRRDSTPLLKPADNAPILQENGLVERRDGSLLMYMRSDQGCQMQCHSTDGGVTWSRPEPSALKSPLSPATIRRIPWSGDLLAVWNDHSGLHPYRKGKRTPLCVAVSQDDGQTWKPSKVIESDPQGWYCYTSITFTGNRALLTYCAGDKVVGGLNRLRVRSLPLEYLSSL